MARQDRRELRARIRATPPRCIRGFQATMFEPYDFQTGGIEPHWKLACGCGATVGTILGRTPEDPVASRVMRRLVGPLAFECAACREVTEIIDPDRHGHCAELARLRGTAEPANAASEPRDRHVCGQCGESRSHDLEAAFGSWDHAYDLAEKIPDLALEDFFAVFTLRAACEKCNGFSWTISRFNRL